MNRTIWQMPKRWVLPFIASWRVFERTLNPAFYFLIKCAKCGTTGSPKVRTVRSNKRDEVLIGIECSECGNTLKFEGAADPEAPEFPDRLKGSRADSVLTPPDEEEPEWVHDLDDLDDYMELVLDG